MTTPDCEQPTRTPDDIDIDALREKYRQEREKRLRPEGSKQYLELTGELAKFYEIDPYSPPVVRDPISEDIYVAVLGGGIAGLLAGAYLKKAGVDDVHVIEMGGDFGASGIGTGSRHPMRQRLVLLHAAAGRTGLHPDQEVRRRRRDQGALSAHRKAFRPLRLGNFFHRGPCASLGRNDQTLADQHQPRRRHPSPFRRHDQRVLQPAETSRDSRHPGLHRPPVPLVPLGLRVHRRDSSGGCISWPTNASP
ncbi:NAD(P)-binding Rossmann-like domain protein [Mycobacterium xenopi 4042]|uniref:NAD(P)-binding Rossmann-like domain protein n=1 Tax=Mycobacterium xenopi 4042 TaxID=1299334 RepID=X8CK32_MYCXE|nr:NAD(P)-binding Rossmann-like domain protein [Mycobacterium xenopi 4042]